MFHCVVFNLPSTRNLCSLEVSTELLRELEEAFRRKKAPNLQEDKSSVSTFVSSDDINRSFHSMTSDIMSLVNSALEHRHSSHAVVKILRELCTSYSPWLVLYLINYLSFVSDLDKVVHGLSMCLLSEQLSSVIFLHESENGAEEPIHTKKECLTPVLNSFKELPSVRDEFVCATPLRLQLLLRVEIPDFTDPSVLVKFQFPDLVARTLLCIHALKSNVSICQAGIPHHVPTVEVNSEFLTACQLGLRSIIPPIVEELLVWYVDSFLFEDIIIKNEYKRYHLDDYFRYIIACLEIISLYACDNASAHNIAWTISTIFCHPIRLQTIMHSLLLRGGTCNNKQRYIVLIMQHSARVLLNVPVETAGVLCPLLSLYGLCSCTSALVRGSLQCNVSDILESLRDSLTTLWSSVLDKRCQLSKPPLSVSIFGGRIPLRCLPSEISEPNSEKVSLMMKRKWHDNETMTISTCEVCLDVAHSSIAGDADEKVQMLCDEVMSVTSSINTVIIDSPQEFVAFPDFALLWNCLLKAPQSSDIKLSSIGAFPEVTVIQYLHEQLYLPLKFYNNRCIRKQVFISYVI